MADREPADTGYVEAAGGLITDGRGRIAIVHRPSHGDWSFPKGHLEPGESHRVAALREVTEETGLECSVSRRLEDIEYTNRFGRPKRVRYFAMVIESGSFAPNAEVDELDWISADGLGRLTYDCDRELAGRRWADVVGEPQRLE